MFIKIKEAYEILSNPETKQNYDRLIRNYEGSSTIHDDATDDSVMNQMREREFERIRQGIYMRAE